MNFHQRLGLFILILISIAYVYFSFFAKEFNMPEFLKKHEKQDVYNPMDNQVSQIVDEQNNLQKKNVKIFILDKSGNLRSMNRECQPSKEFSCFEYAIKELISAPSEYEKAKGYISEIPAGTKLLSVRESSNSVMVDLSSEFETGGGAESTYLRIKQVIRTANANTSTPVYLYINGRQANVIGGEGVMIKQPLNEHSLEE